MPPRGIRQHGQGYYAKIRPDLSAYRRLQPQGFLGQVLQGTEPAAAIPGIQHLPLACGDAWRRGLYGRRHGVDDLWRESGAQAGAGREWDWIGDVSSRSRTRTSSWAPPLQYRPQRHGCAATWISA